VFYNPLWRESTFAMQTQIDYGRLQAPREDRTALIEPPLEEVGELVAENLHERHRLRDYDLHGRWLSDVSLQARAELLAAARRWTAAYRDVNGNVEGDSPIFADAKIGTVPAADANGLMYLAGHQPQMFHPGVWFKNFVLGEVARCDGATAINLIIDGDTLADAAVRVPGGSVDRPHFVQTPFDSPDGGIPYEERRIEDRELFGSFGRRAIEQMSPFVADPLLRQYWPMVLARSRECDNLGACLAQARHQWEASWGLQTLEVPQSCMCRGEAFQWFVAHLFVSLPEFRKIYNESLREYRQRHRLRSRHHPAPDLIEEGAWEEAPFWVWTAADPRRRRLFIQATADETLLSDRQSWQARLPLSPEGDAAKAVDQLLALQRGGVRIRPRAMITTLWARLALGDLFVHGIGGAKYDCVTDRLIERFFGLVAPRFLVVSATLHLPIPRQHTMPDDVRAIRQELRAMTYQPERFLGETGIPVCQGRRGEECPPQCESLIAEKRRWLATPQTPQNARERFRAIRHINAALQPQLDRRREQLAARLVQASQSLQAESVLAWREYAFCLYPESTLREFLSGLLHRTV
jgi:hypothetical protein